MNIDNAHEWEDDIGTWIACDCCGAVSAFGESEQPPFYCDQCGKLMLAGEEDES